MSLGMSPSSPLIMNSINTTPVVGNLEIKIIHGRLAPCSYYFPAHKIIVQFEYRGEKYRTDNSTSNDSRKPLWDHRFHIPV